jgi:alanine dehydrogenase
MRSEARLLLIDKDMVEARLQPDDVTDAVREAFLLHGRREGRVFPVVREASLKTECRRSPST